VIGRERPPAVTRFRNSTLWLPLAVVAVLGWAFVVEDLPASRPVRLDSAREVAVTGRVLGRTPGGAVEVGYYHPTTEQDIEAEVEVWDGDLVPERGGNLRLIVRRDDPLAAAAAGDATPLTANLAGYAMVIAGACLPAAMRRFSVRRTEHLAEAEVPSFAMVAALTPHRRRHRGELHLYALDATERARPVCTVPVLTTGQARIGSQVFPVEVKGSPRPLGRVVARTAGAVLWPAGRAGRRSVHPRPPGPSQPVEPLPAADAPPARPGPTSLRMGLRQEAVLLGGALATMAVIVAVTLQHQADARRLVANGIPVLAEVVRHEGVDDVVVLRYRANGAGHLTKAPADVATDYRKGVSYPIRLDPDDPARARLDAEPYDASEPIVWGAMPAAAALVWFGVRWRGWRANRRAAEGGPWSQVWASGAADVGELVLTDEHGRVVCGVIAPGAWVSQPTPAVVAGAAEPGAPAALWLQDGWCRSLVRPATNGASRWRPWGRRGRGATAGPDQPHPER
jgi:hypothetical protein